MKRKVYRLPMRQMMQLWKLLDKERAGIPKDLVTKTDQAIAARLNRTAGLPFKVTANQILHYRKENNIDKDRGAIQRGPSGGGRGKLRAGSSPMHNAVRALARQLLAVSTEYGVNVSDEVFALATLGVSEGKGKAVVIEPESDEPVVIDKQQAVPVH